ncbi:Uncharacterised protein [Bordetella pertussis]|nr:Uncharacterised protein [Bordetella pertussis]
MACATSGNSRSESAPRSSNTGMRSESYSDQGS